ncbi:MAG TPA: hypothetical protein VFU15_03580, partial [Bacteroidia bacterium]|nr:hypothetical protein [Bacteroidia bacterium]
VTADKVKFKKTADGPVYTMDKSDIFMIVYENGRKEVFSNDSSTSPSAATPTKGDDDDEIVPRKHYGGPRAGMTCFGPGTIAGKLHTNVISQFGWQFETRFFTLDNGSSGLFEFVPMLGGLESGKFLPSATAIVGYRTGSGFEFGIGPNLSQSGFGIVFAGGASFRSGKVLFPVNIAFQPSVNKTYYAGYYDASSGQYVPGERTLATGFRVSLLVGFNARKN